MPLRCQYALLYRIRVACLLVLLTERQILGGNRDEIFYSKEKGAYSRVHRCLGVLAVWPAELISERAALRYVLQKHAKRHVSVGGLQPSIS